MHVATNGTSAYVVIGRHAFQVEVSNSGFISAELFENDITIACFTEEVTNDSQEMTDDAGDTIFFINTDEDSISFSNEYDKILTIQFLNLPSEIKTKRYQNKR